MVKNWSWMLSSYLTAKSSIYYNPWSTVDRYNGCRYLSLRLNIVYDMKNNVNMYYIEEIK